MQFGNAGRGLVFPLRVAGTNEPNDYRSTTNTRWSMAKVNSAARLPEPGISGISIFSDLNGSFFDISTFDHDGLDYSFNQVTLIHTKDSMQFDCRISDSPPKYGYLMSAQSFSADDCTSWVAFTHTTNYVLVQSEQTEAAQQSFTINGLVLSNGKPGILYHSIGINGARYSDYNNSPLFFKQLKILNPDLVIISLGTNEGANVKVNGEETIAAITSMIHSIRSLNPSTCILIATPTDDYWRKKYKNPYLESVERSLLKSVEMENVACWDMYNITGGYGSCVRWRKAKLMQRDGVHFNKEGYTLQGYLLYKAIIDSFSRYAAH